MTAASTSAPGTPDVGAVILQRLTANTATIQIPVNTPGQDYLLIAIGSAAAVVVQPAGFTQLYIATTGGNHQQLGVYGKVAAGESSTTASTGQWGASGSYYSTVIKGTTTAPSIAAAQGQTISGGVPANESAQATCFGFCVVNVGPQLPVITGYPALLTDNRAMFNADNFSTASFAGASATLEANAAPGNYSFNQSMFWRTARVSFRAP